MPVSLDKILVEKLSIVLEKSLIDATSVLGITVTRKDMVLHENFTDEVICSIGITGEFNGNLCIAIPQKMACEFVSKMLGDTYAKVTDDVLDGCREITNMVAGGIKTGMASQHYEFNIGLPTSLIGQTLHMRFNPSDVIIHQQYRCTDGEFEMYLVCRQNESNIHEQAVSKPAALPKDAASSLLDKLKNNPHSSQ